MKIQMLQIETPTLGDRSYLFHDGSSAIVIDPQRDIDRIEKLLDSEGLVLSAVAETHLHNDYLTGGLELSRKFDVPYILNRDSEVAFRRFAIHDEEIFVVGNFAIKAIRTPGHTYEHMAYIILDSDEQVVGIATGGSLLHGTTGRPDLLGWEFANELAGLQYDSAHLLSKLASNSVILYPTHGFGSFCSAAPSQKDAISIGDQKTSNPVFIKSKPTYVSETISGLDIFPNYFDKMAPANSEGPEPISLANPPSVTSHEVEERLGKGTWVLDLRNREAWSAKHLTGSINLGLDGSMASYLGWLLPHNHELILISDKESDISTAIRELARIGIESPVGSFIGDPSLFQNASTVKSVTFKDFESSANRESTTVLDVRQNLEREKAHIAESMHIPFYEVMGRISELPTDSEIWVHCATGYRAATVLGAIEASGRTVVLIDDDFENAAQVSVFEIIDGTNTSLR